MGIFKSIDTNIKQHHERFKELDKENDKLWKDTEITNNQRSKRVELNIERMENELKEIVKLQNMSKKGWKGYHDK